MDCGRSCIKYLLFTFNLLCFVSNFVWREFSNDPSFLNDHVKKCAGAVVALAAILLNRSGSLSQVTFALDIVPIVLLLLGLVSALISFFGCCGAIRQSTCLLYTVSMCCLQERFKPHNNNHNTNGPTASNSTPSFSWCCYWRKVPWRLWHCCKWMQCSLICSGIWNVCGTIVSMRWCSGISCNRRWAEIFVGWCFNLYLYTDDHLQLQCCGLKSAVDWTAANVPEACCMVLGDSSASSTTGGQCSIADAWPEGCETVANEVFGLLAHLLAGLALVAAIIEVKTHSLKTCNILQRDNVSGVRSFL